MARLDLGAMLLAISATIASFAGHASVATRLVHASEANLLRSHAGVATQVRFAVKAMDATGAPASLIPVQFRMASQNLCGLFLANGTLPIEALANTDASGVAAVDFVWNPAAPECEVVASVPSAPSVAAVRFRMMQGLPPLVLQGSGEISTKSFLYTDVYTRVTRNDQPVPGEVVEWSVRPVEGVAGTLSNASAETDARGYATVRATAAGAGRWIVVAKARGVEKETIFTVSPNSLPTGAYSLQPVGSLRTETRPGSVFPNGELAVRVTLDGQPAAGVTVNFSVQGYLVRWGGDYSDVHGSSYYSMTGPDGIAAMSHLYGALTGTSAVRIHTELAPEILWGTAVVAGKGPARVETVSTAAQFGKLGFVVGSAFVARVVDEDGLPVPRVETCFSALPFDAFIGSAPCGWMSFPPGDQGFGTFDASGRPGYVFAYSGLSNASGVFSAPSTYVPLVPGLQQVRAFAGNRIQGPFTIEVAGGGGLEPGLRTLTWTGAAPNGNFSHYGNWGGYVPNGGDRLRFPARPGGGTWEVNNDLGGTFDSVELLEGANVIMRGQPLRLWSENPIKLAASSLLRMLAPVETLHSQARMALYGGSSGSNFSVLDLRQALTARGALGIESNSRDHVYLGVVTAPLPVKANVGMLSATLPFPEGGLHVASGTVVFHEPNHGQVGGTLVLEPGVWVGVSPTPTGNPSSVVSMIAPVRVIRGTSGSTAPVTVSRHSDQLIFESAVDVEEGATLRVFPGSIFNSLSGGGSLILSNFANLPHAMNSFSGTLRIQRNGRLSAGEAAPGPRARIVLEPGSSWEIFHQTGLADALDCSGRMTIVPGKARVILLTTVKLSQCILELAPATSIPQPGTEWTLLESRGGRVQGEFLGLPEGHEVVINGVPMKLSYRGGTGNDVTLKAKGKSPEQGLSASEGFGGLWWAGPGENGWGISLVEHGERMFAVLYVYDDQGRPEWVAMPGGAWSTSGASISGNLYVPRGAHHARYDAASFVPGAAVGSATFTFTDANNGTLAYTVRGKSGSKTISRQQFIDADGVPPWLDLRDMWWGGPSQDGWGVSVQQQGLTLFLVWFTYDAAGHPTWYVMPGGFWTSLDFTRYEGRIFRTQGAAWAGVAYDAGALVPMDVGAFTLEVNRDGTLGVQFTIDGVPGALRLQRQPF